jgi:tetratricopeptide (TPR) repeat protein
VIKSMALVLALFLVASRLGAQQATYDRAFDLERRGSYLAAAEVYRQVLRVAPADVNALLGLERVLHELGRADAMGPDASAALAADAKNPVLYGAAVRAWTAAGQPDSVRRLVARWAQIEPGSEAPYREWGFGALGRRDRAGARQAYLAGREDLRRSDALAGELAQLATVDGDYAVAVTEWLNALRAIPGYRASAVGMLSQVPMERRPFVLGLLERRGGQTAASLAAALSARWGDPLGGYQILAGAIAGGDSGLVALQEFQEELRSVGGPDAAGARARTLEAMADRSGRGGAQRLAEAARAYAEAGDQAAARRMLGRLASDPAAAPELAAMAGTTLVEVLVAEGRLDEADRRLTELHGAISADEQERLAHQLARGLLQSGRLDRAEQLLSADSTVEGFGLRGQVRLLRGDLVGASADLATAGPYALDRADATERSALLALLQVIDADSLPALGLAFQALARGDSAAAARAFEEVAGDLPPERGGGELHLLAGRVQMGRALPADAERLFGLAGKAPGTAAAAAARLELARLMVRQGRQPEAIAALEQLILEYPSSTAAPQARRLLDVVKGGVPRG